MEIAVNHFQTECLKILSTIETLEEEVIITQAGKPIAKIVPFLPKKTVLFGRMTGTGKIIGNIEEPLGETWNVEQ